MLEDASCCLFLSFPTLFYLAQTLRKVLDQRGFKNVQIIASDSGDWEIAGDIQSDKDLDNVIYALG